MTRRLLTSAILLASLLLSAPTAAQDDWGRPLEGFTVAVFGERTGLGVLVVTPADDEASKAVEAAVKKLIADSGLAELVMDDAPLGDMTGKSDEEILAAARKYPVDVVVLLRTFPGGDAGPTAVVWIETTNAGEPETFRMRPGGAPPWARRPPPNPVQSEDPTVVAASNAADFGRQEAAMARMGAVGVAETLRLIGAEEGRRLLAFEVERRPIVRDPGGEIVPWPRAYTLMDRADLASSYKRRRATRTALMAAGATLAAAGLGLLFVTLANQANCGTDAGCARPLLLGASLGSLGAGAAGIATGLLIRPHSIKTEEIRTLVDEHNTAHQ